MPPPMSSPSRSSLGPCCLLHPNACPFLPSFVFKASASTRITLAPFSRFRLDPTSSSRRASLTPLPSEVRRPRLVITLLTDWPSSEELWP